MNREYRVWNEVGDLIGEFDAARPAESCMERERAACSCGEEPGPDGLFCGVLHPHGISLGVVEDGMDVTQDYLING